MRLDYKPTRYEGKCFLHRDITGDRCGLGWIRLTKEHSRIIQDFTLCTLMVFPIFLSVISISRKYKYSIVSSE